MSGPRRCGSRRLERTAAVGDNSNGYVETDPTGRYGRFDELLGKGAMKSVYRGFDEVRGVEVAWNQANLSDVLRTPDALQRMYSEVHLLSTLRHDAIIAFHASWVDASRRTFNFITELFSSGTLRAYRLRYPRVSLRAVKAWARQILRGLAYLHSHDPPVIHRDLKCDNIFVNGHQGQVKIGDLGLAAVLRGARAAHSVIGTPEFMAPEMYEEEYNELVDVYSFGMCMLEMLTTEYPYSECSNPAQIYKKVTSGKLPDAFYRVEDKEARRFIGRSLVAASKRPSAEELLLDPFLSLQDDHATSCAPVMAPLPAPACSNLSSHDHDEESSEQPPARTDMTITGKLNSEYDTIFLRVQIADETGHVRNIYFPFDIAGDTAMDVAKEMVKELDIADRDPSEIAAMIEQEIGKLVPGWVGNGDEKQECYTYADDDDDDEDGEHPPYYYLSSSPTSSQGSLCGVGPSASGRSCGPHAGRGHAGWLQDYHCYPLSSDEDDMSSVHSGGKYAALHYCSGDDEAQASKTGQVRVTRFGQGESSSSPRNRADQAEQYETLAHQLQRRCSMSGRRRHRGRGSREVDDRRTLSRNRSMVDMRSQLLHRTLVEELNKRLFFNTVGAVEDIGFRLPCYGPSSSSSSSRGADHRRRTSKDKHNYMF